jgi:hypothetical protein
MESPSHQTVAVQAPGHHNFGGFDGHHTAHPERGP